MIPQEFALKVGLDVFPAVVGGSVDAAKLVLKRKGFTFGVEVMEAIGKNISVLDVKKGVMSGTFNLFGLP